MTKPTTLFHPDSRTRTRLQTLLGASCLAAFCGPLLVPGLAFANGAASEAAAPAPAPASSPEPFATPEWRHQQQATEAPTGRATRQWLQTQGSGEQASTNRPTLSGPALRRVHDRYLRTFEVDIPQQLRESLPANK